MEYELMKNHIVNEMEAVNKKFQSFMGFLPDWEEMKNYLTSDTGKKIFYFDSKLKEQDKGDKKSVYAWVDTGYCKNRIPIFLSLINHDGEYSGYYIGTAKNLMEGMCNKDPYHIKEIRRNFDFFNRKLNKIMEKRARIDKVGDEICKVKVCDIAEIMKTNVFDKVDTKKSDGTLDEKISKQYSDVTEEIYNALLYPNWKSMDGLDTYIKVIGRRISQLMAQDRSEYYEKNRMNSVVVNTGLMDQFGSDYLVLYKYHVKQECYVAARVMHSKVDYIEEGFFREQSGIRIKPISFWNEGQNQYLSITYDDLDINSRCLSHVVERSIERLPEVFQGLSADRIVQTLRNAIEVGFRFLEKDRHCAKAIYSGGKISWLLPFRVNTSYDEEPELVIVISESTEFYEVKTILPYDDEVKDKITALSLYHQCW